jgi:hypothetical protein
MKGDRAACVPRVPWTPLRGAVPQKNRGKPKGTIMTGWTAARCPS